MRKVRHHHLDNVGNLLHALLHVQHRDEGLSVVAMHLFSCNRFRVLRALVVRDYVQVQRNCARVLEQALQQQLVLLLQHLRLLRVDHKQIVRRPIDGRPEPSLLLRPASRVIHQQQAFVLVAAVHPVHPVGCRGTEGGRVIVVVVATTTVKQPGPCKDVIVGVEDEQEPADNDEH